MIFAAHDESISLGFLENWESSVPTNVMERTDLIVFALHQNEGVSSNAESTIRPRLLEMRSMRCIQPSLSSTKSKEREHLRENRSSLKLKQRTRSPPTRRKSHIPPTIPLTCTLDSNRRSRHMEFFGRHLIWQQSRKLVMDCLGRKV